MKRRIGIWLVTACLVGAWAAPCQAHGAWRGGHRGGVFLGFGLGFGGPLYPAPLYPAPVYPAPVYPGWAYPGAYYAPPYYVPRYAAPAYVVPQAPPGPPAYVAPQQPYVAPPAYRGPLNQQGTQPAAPPAAASGELPYTCQSAAVGEQLARGGPGPNPVGGAIIGALLAGDLGRQIDIREQACIAQALEFAPPGQRIAWEGLHADAHFTVVAGQVEQRGDAHCRSFETDIRSDRSGQRKTFATACRRSDGIWLNAG